MEENQAAASPKPMNKTEIMTALAEATGLTKQQVAGLFLPWSVANAEAIASGAEEFSVELASGTWTQKPQKYHARSLAKLRNRYSALADRSELDPVLEKSGCLRWIAAD